MDRRRFLQLAAAGTAATQASCARAQLSRLGFGPSPQTLGGLYHPASEDNIVELIRFARTNQVNVRVRGSGHSVTHAIYAGQVGADGSWRGGVNMMLDALRRVSFDDQRRQVTVQAGCNLGMDPKDPSGTSTLENGLFWQLGQHGWAVPDMGGIIHQSVGGFLSTGSAGGSLQHSIYDSIVAIRLIDGTGQVRELRRPANDSEPANPFFGAAISMGLLGVVTAVTFQCIPAYHVMGREVVTDIQSAPFKLFEGGPDALEVYLRRTEHARVLWWPQAGVGKVVTWEAKRMAAGDYTSETGTRDAFKAKPYHLLPPILGSRTFAQHFASTVFDVFAPLNPPPPRDGVERTVENALASLFPGVVNGYLKPPEGEEQGRAFWDDWWKTLPMDNEADDDLIPTEFTELWMPIDRTRDVMVALRDHYAAGGFAATGTNACEIYAAKASPFWMSPAFGQDVLRVDLFWYARNSGNPAEAYYPQFWQRLGPFGPRFHWGKHLPSEPAALSARYPRWNDFLSLRAQLDPDGVFLTPYWREKLGIA